MTRDTETVHSCEILDVQGTDAVLRIEWNGRLNRFFEVYHDSGARLLGGSQQENGWEFRLLFDDALALDTFYENCIERDVAIDIEHVFSTDEFPNIGVTNELTDAQLETIKLALDRGYYDVPRGINLSEISEEIDVSDTAASQRIRRGLKKVLTTLLEDSTPLNTSGENPETDEE